MFVKTHKAYYISKNRFVLREEAAEIAYNADQTNELLDRLFSEDLY